MLLLADQNFNGDILRGVLRRIAKLDVVRIQDLGMSEAEDPEVLAYAADHGRVLLTHDRKTLTDFAFERVAAQQPMPGVISVPARMGIGAAIEDIVLIVEVCAEGELTGKVLFLPL